MTQPNKPIVGQPLSLTPEQLDQAAMVTPVDVAIARHLWHQHAPPAMADLLEAAPIRMAEFPSSDPTMGGL